MYMKHDRNTQRLFDYINSGQKVYKKALLHGIMTSTGYKLALYTKMYHRELISQLWLNLCDSTEWTELAKIDRVKWTADKRIELGIT